MKKLLAPMLVMVFALMGCESMTVSECKVADWGRVGFKDGAQGEQESRLAAYTKDCGKAGVLPNAQAYRQGWDAGILRFCTAANGWREGVQGHSGKSLVCQGQAGYEPFSHYLEAGLRVYRTNESLQRNGAEIQRLQKLLDEPKSDDEKRRLREQLHDIDRDQYRLRAVLGQQQMYAP
jgi:hypothetical protein